MVRQYDIYTSAMLASNTITITTESMADIYIYSIQDMYPTQNILLITPVAQAT